MRNFSPRREIVRADTSNDTFDPLRGSAWSDASMVAGFSRSAANSDLLAYAERKTGAHPLHVLDIGCGAGRNAVPLARAGHLVTGTDMSWPMLDAANRRGEGALAVVCAPMHALPVRTGAFDLIVAHGIWNLAQSSLEFRAALAEAARAAAPGAALFVFTFSRHTLDDEALPLDGETFVFSQFSGLPQIFLTADQLRSELAAVGFVADPEQPLRELKLTPPGAARGQAPVIFQAGFVFEGR
jgi:SAM-dependent methyltransferase